MRTRDLLNLIFEAWGDFFRHQRIPHNGWSVRGAHDAMTYMNASVSEEYRARDVGVLSQHPTRSADQVLSMVRALPDMYIPDALKDDVMAALAHLMRYAGFDDVRRVIDSLRSPTSRRYQEPLPAPWEVVASDMWEDPPKRKVRPRKGVSVLEGASGFVVVQAPFTGIRNTTKLFASREAADTAMGHMGDLVRDTCAVEEVVIIKKSALDELANSGSVILNVAPRATLGALAQMSWPVDGGLNVLRRME